ncbi:CRISPR-associated DxTHG motif protein [Yersinia enterocolitica]
MDTTHGINFIGKFI